MLTEPRFAQRLREHIKHEKELTLLDAALLKIGRHFRLDKAKIIVGRNKKENKKLLIIARNREIPYLEAIEYNGPITLYLGTDKR